ncbi:MAG: HEAT repeat domain-containing protein [Cyanobacteria bacterium J06642_2]
MNSFDHDAPDAAPPLTEAEAIANIKGSDSGLRFYAAWWLGKYRSRHPEAVDLLIDALQDESDRTEDGGYPLRRNSARALGKLGDTRAVPALIECLESPDYYVREAAVQSLEALKDSRCVPRLLAFLVGGVAAAKPVLGKPHLVQPYDGILEALGTLQVREAMPQITEFLDHSLPRVAFAAARAMYQLTGEDDYGRRLIRGLEGDNLQLRRAALMDLSATDYTPAASAIAETLAENSLKLIALKGILELHITAHSGENPDDFTAAPQANEILHLMDGLL